MLNDDPIPLKSGILDEIIQIENDRIKYLIQNKEYDYSDPEEKVRASVYLDYVRTYKYPPKRIDFEIYAEGR